MSEKHSKLTGTLDSLKAELINVSTALRETRLDLSWEFLRAAETVRKAQEQLKEPSVPEIEGGGTTWWYVCGECHGNVDKRDHYCRHCGKELIWS